MKPRKAVVIASKAAAPLAGKLALLAPYISGDDIDLAKHEFLQMVADRIYDDLVGFSGGFSYNPKNNNPIWEELGHTVERMDNSMALTQELGVFSKDSGKRKKHVASVLIPIGAMTVLLLWIKRGDSTLRLAVDFRGAIERIILNAARYEQNFAPEKPPIDRRTKSKRRK